MCVFAADAAVALQCAAAVVLYFVAAVEMIVGVSAVEMFVTGVLVVHDVAVVVAGPQALPTTFAIGHCFAVN